MIILNYDYDEKWLDEIPLEDLTNKIIIRLQHADLIHFKTINTKLYNDNRKPVTNGAIQWFKLKFHYNILNKQLYNKYEKKSIGSILKTFKHSKYGN